jgi:hypothetical protein
MHQVRCCKGPHLTCLVVAVSAPPGPHAAAGNGGQRTDRFLVLRRSENGRWLALRNEKTAVSQSFLHRQNPHRQIFGNPGKGERDENCIHHFRRYRHDDVGECRN